MTFGINVLGRSDPPRIVSTPVRTAPFGLPYVYDVEAFDPDPFESQVFFLLEGPPGMTIDSASGVITWLPAIGDVGFHDVGVIAQDVGGILSEPQRYVLEVTGDETAPVVAISPHIDPSWPGQTVTLTVTATDQVGATIEFLEVEGVPIPLDAFGRGPWTAPAPGVYLASASAVDPTGNRGTATYPLRVLDSSDLSPPVVELTAPATDEILTYLHDATGTVRDDNLVRWWLEIRRADNGLWRELSTGTNEVDDALIGRFDVTQTHNGIHELRLRAEDANGQIGQASIPVRIEGNAKLGVVHLEFTDLVLPDFGFPVAVNRVYDSRDADRRGDFGYGWSLDFRQGSITQNHVYGRGISVYTQEADLPNVCERFLDQLGHFAEVRIGDDEWYTFRPAPLATRPVSGGCGGEMGYELVDGSSPGAELIIRGNREVRATAIPVGSEGPLAQSVFRDLLTGEVFDPQDFELRLQDGRRFGLNAERGIEYLVDKNGNAISFVDRGVYHRPAYATSSGRGVQFVFRGRRQITQAIDASGRSVRYGYDAHGNLSFVIDVLGRATRFEYNAPQNPHYLTAIIDHRGVRTAAIEYDDGGRMRQLCDPDGRCVQNEYDLEAQSMIRFTGLPRPTVYGYDHRGNIRSVRNGLDEVTLYDHRGPRDVLVSRTDADGAVTRFEYRGRSRDVMARIDPHLPGEDPEDFTTRFGYRLWDVNFLGEARRAELNEIRLPTGGTIHYEVDDDGNRLEERDDADNVLITRAFNPDGTIDERTPTASAPTATSTAPTDNPTQVTEPDGTVDPARVRHPRQCHPRLKRNGVEQRFLYDALGRRLFSPTTATAPPSPTNTTTATTGPAIVGPTFGRVERVVSAAGNVLELDDPQRRHRPRKTFDPAGQLIDNPPTPSATSPPSTSTTSPARLERDDRSR